MCWCVDLMCLLYVSICWLDVLICCVDVLTWCADLICWLAVLMCWLDALTCCVDVLTWSVDLLCWCGDSLCWFAVLTRCILCCPSKKCLISFPFSPDRLLSVGQKRVRHNYPIRPDTGCTLVVTKALKDRIRPVYWGDVLFVQHCDMSCRVVFCSVLLCCVVLCCVVLYCVVLCCVVLHCIVLCCAVLCCGVLCCVVLCCAVRCVVFRSGTMISPPPLLQTPWPHASTCWGRWNRKWSHQRRRRWSLSPKSGERPEPPRLSSHLW